MATTLQIRHVPDEIHAAARTRAAQAGVSVSDYLLDLLSELLTRPTMAEVVERAKRLAQGGGADPDEIRAVVRAGRDR